MTSQAPTHTPEAITPDVAALSPHAGAPDIAALWGPLRMALIEHRGRLEAAEWLEFCAKVMRADHGHVLAIRERKAAMEAQRHHQLSGASVRA